MLFLDTSFSRFYTISLGVHWKRRSCRSSSLPKGRCVAYAPRVNRTQIAYSATGRPVRVRTDGAQDDQRSSRRVPFRADTPRLHLRRVPPTAASRVLDSKFGEGMRSRLVLVYLSGIEPRVMLELSERNPPLRCNGELQDSPESPAQRSMYVLLVYPGPR